MDAGFKYVPAARTDVAATWRRFGFDPRVNEDRRAHAKMRNVAIVAGKRP